MLSQRSAQRTLRRLVQQPAYRYVVPAVLRSTAAFTGQRRLAATQGAQSAADKTAAILAEQRLHRPISPHLGIYRPQITWYLSILNRITGAALSGGFYIFGTLYLIAPYAGWHLESAVLAAGFASWPIILQFLAKLTIAFPFAFHGLNGIRHLTWDMASMISNKQVNQTGWLVVGLSTIGAIALAIL